MKIIAGVDIGNATTEVALGEVKDDKIFFLGSGIVSTTGVKGTKANISGVYSCLKKVAKKSNINIEDIDLIRINEATPVIGDVAMETITETIITESTIIGHNPETPGGVGVGTGCTCNILDLDKMNKKSEVIVVVPKEIDFNETAKLINKFAKEVNINGAIVQNDDGVLINNRLNKPVPIIDEVRLIEKVPLGMEAIVEVAQVGGIIEVLSNPYGVASYFKLTPEETKQIVPIARALIGNRSAVVIKTPQGKIRKRVIPAGDIIAIGEKKEVIVSIERGSKDIMKSIESCNPLVDIRGTSGTNAGGMIQKVKLVMSKLTEMDLKDVKIRDLLAVDTFVPQKVIGGVAAEIFLESAVGIAAMVKANKLQMNLVAEELQEKLNIDIEIGGVEANMAIKGSLTTPGTDKPLAILDMGAGSTDASIMNKEGKIKSTHLAGAGDMVTMLIDSELGLQSKEIAEEIKKYPLAKVESLFHIRHEDGTVQFFEDGLGAEVFAKVVILKENSIIPLDVKHSIEKIRLVRREAKRKVFVTNAIRALRGVTLTKNIRDIEFVVLVGGSALDFEIPEIVTEALSVYGIVAGKGNIRGKEGPRNAVATGLVLSTIR